MVSLFQATCLTKNFTRGLIILLSDLRDEGFHEWSHYSPAVLKRKPSAIFFFKREGRRKRKTNAMEKRKRNEYGVGLYALY
jgi:hypothetical protein